MDHRHSMGGSACMVKVSGYIKLLEKFCWPWWLQKYYYDLSSERERMGLPSLYRHTQRPGRFYSSCLKNDVVCCAQIGFFGGRSRLSDKV